MWHQIYGGDLHRLQRLTWLVEGTKENNRTMFQALKKCSCRLSGSSEKRAFERRNSTGLMSFYNEGLTLFGTNIGRHSFVTRHYRAYRAIRAACWGLGPSAIVYLISSGSVCLPLYSWSYPIIFACAKALTRSFSQFCCLFNSLGLVISLIFVFIFLIH